MNDVASDIWSALISCRNPGTALATANGDDAVPLTLSNRREIACEGSPRLARRRGAVVS